CAWSCACCDLSGCARCPPPRRSWRGRKGLWSAPHPGSAIPSQCRPLRRIPASPPPTPARRPPRIPSRESRGKPLSRPQSPGSAVHCRQDVQDVQDVQDIEDGPQHLPERKQRLYPLPQVVAQHPQPCARHLPSLRCPCAYPPPSVSHIIQVSEEGGSETASSR